MLIGAEGTWKQTDSRSWLFVFASSNVVVFPKFIWASAQNVQRSSSVCYFACVCLSLGWRGCTLRPGAAPKWSRCWGQQKDKTCFMHMISTLYCLFFTLLLHNIKISQIVLIAVTLTLKITNSAFEMMLKITANIKSCGWFGFAHCKQTGPGFGWSRWAEQLAISSCPNVSGRKCSKRTLSSCFRAAASNIQMH